MVVVLEIVKVFVCEDAVAGYASSLTDDFIEFDVEVLEVVIAYSVAGVVTEAQADVNELRIGHDFRLWG
jgi:hypothetical protein